MDDPTFLQFFGVAALLGIIMSFSLATPLWVPRLVFGDLIGPESVSDRGRAWPPYSIADGMTFVFLLAITNSVETYDEIGPTWVSRLALNGFVCITWVWSLVFMERHSIRRRSSRLVLQVVLFPVSVVAAGQFFAAPLLGWCLESEFAPVLTVLTMSLSVGTILTLRMMCAVLIKTSPHCGH
ncbi:MAG: hypothetical protein QGG36_21155 [Pirellulaceae bacterium]|jgi:hypothetical protein|nr:hypothetical protein [Pirellulaceae bacterium]MDP7018328.1 hypothetical protein [Pirellulaceae bacterium]